MPTTAVARGVIFLVCPFVHVSVGLILVNMIFQECLEGNFITSGTNVQLDGRMNLLKSCRSKIT